MRTKLNLKKWTSLLLAVTMMLGSTAALAEDIALLPDEYQAVTGTVTGDLEAKGRFYADYSSIEENMAEGNRVHLKMTEEGQTLLKNDGVLPLAADERKVTFLGIGTVDVVRSAAGYTSPTSYVKGWADSFDEQGFVVNPKTIELYQNLYALMGTMNGGEMVEVDMSYYGPSVTSTFKTYNDVALVCLTRYGAENIDNKTNNVPGHSDENEHYYQLDDNEKALIKMAKAHFDKVVVMVNSPIIMQIPELAADASTEYGVNAILWVGGLGDQGTVSAARILKGEVNPSGRTVDTWYSDFTKDPTFTNFGDMSQNIDANGERMTPWLVYPDGKMSVYSNVQFREGIYLGYRYYETRCDDMNAAQAGSGDAWYTESVTFPFGYGLDYTDFEWRLAGITADKTIDQANQIITVQVEVENTGKVAGKDVVQLYYNPPYTKGGIEKASVNLVGFEKTKLLQPGEKDVVTIQFVAQDMASYDWNDVNENDFIGYELEKGDYIITARRNAHEVVLTETFTIAEDILCKTDYVTGNVIESVFVDDFDTTREDLLDNMMSRANGLKQPPAQTPEERIMSEFEAELLDSQETYYPYMDEEGQPWYVSEVPANWTQNAPTDVTLADLAGNPYTEPNVVDGVATAASDEVSQAWDAYMNSLSWEELVDIVGHSPGSTESSVQAGDGTMFQPAPITAATWNKELIAEMGLVMANYCLLSGNHGINGVGCNIHRSPFCGRICEYYSEDPLVSGTAAAIMVDAYASKGVISYAKHFFANTQEHNRADYGGVCTFATEQTFREIYLKTFQAMVRAGSMGLMTSFNRVGYVVNSNNWAVHEDLLRDEWNFAGGTVTDAWARDFVSLDLMARAGDDVVLGSMENFMKTTLTAGQWDAAARDGEGMVIVPDADGNMTLLSPTHYYAVRKSAQRVIQTWTNSNKYKNYAASDELTATLFYGLKNTASVNRGAGSYDFSITVAEGQALPAGMSLDGFVLNYDAPVIGQLEMGDEGYKSGWGADNNIYGDYTPQGTYEVLVDMEADGYLKVSGVKLTIHVVSPFQVNDAQVVGQNGEAVQIKLAKGEATDLVIDSEPYSYQSVLTPGAMSPLVVTNWYTQDGRKYLRNEEKTHADGTTIPYEAVEEKHEVAYVIEGELPAGLTAEVIIGTAHGMRTNKAFDVVTGIRIAGTAVEPGTYNVTVVATIPTCTAGFGIFYSPSSEVVISQPLTIIVE